MSDRGRIHREVYHTTRWRNLRASALDRQPLCQRCGLKGLTVGACVVHHVRPIREGGDPWDPGNLECVCRKCHNAEHNAPEPEPTEVRAWRERKGRRVVTRQDARKARGFGTP